MHALRSLSQRVARLVPPPKLVSSGIRDFVPTAKQAEFIRAIHEGKHSECYFLGANRTGKTKVGAYIGSQIALEGFPWALGQPTAGWVVSLDFPMSRDTIQPYYFRNGYGVGIEPFIDASQIRRFDRQAQTLFLRNGSTISFKSADSGADKFQAAGKDWVNKDEVMSKAIDDEISIRVKAGTRLVQWTTATLLPPEDKVGDMHWLYESVIKPWKEGSRINHITNASIYDNPHLLRSEIERLEDKYPVGSKSRRIRLDGELLPGISGSLVYSGFAHQVHVVPHAEIDPHYPVMWSWDFNVSPMTSLIAQRIGGITTAIHEFWMDEGSIPEMCALFMEKVLSSVPVWVYGDATGKARSSHTRMTSYQIVMNELVSAGYSVKLVVPEVNPSVSDRINTVNSSFASHDGLITVRIHNSCKNLISDFEAVVFDANNGIKKSTRHNDPYRWRTHISDAWGYLIHKVQPIKVVRPQEEAQKIRQVKYGKQSSAA